MTSVMLTLIVVNKKNQSSLICNKSHGLWCLMPLSTVFSVVGIQLIHSIQIIFIDHPLSLLLLWLLHCQHFRRRFRVGFGLWYLAPLSTIVSVIGIIHSLQNMFVDPSSPFPPPFLALLIITLSDFRGRLNRDDIFQLFNWFQLFSSEIVFRKLLDRVRKGQKWLFWKGV